MTMDSRLDSAAPLTLGLAFTALVVAPVLGDWSGSAVGLGCEAAPSDMWSLWSWASTSEGSTHMGFPGPTTSASLSSPSALMLFAGLMSILGPVASWNTAVLLSMLVLLLGTIDLSRRIQPDASPIARSTLVIAVVGTAAWSPLIRHVGVSALPMAALPLALSLLDRWIQPDASRRWGIIAAATVTFAMLGHWVTTVFVMAILIPMLVIQCRALEGRQVWRRAGGALSPGLILGVFHVGIQAEAGSGIQVDAASIGPAWIHQMEGALALPATAAAALPGLGVLLLALAGVAARPKQTAGWLLVSAWGILLAAGLSPDGLNTWSPAHHLAARLPQLVHIDSWWAIAPLVALPMGLSAMIGVDILHRVRRDRLAVGVLIMAVIDQMLPAFTTSTPQSFLHKPPMGVMTALSNLGPGAVLQLPAQDETQCQIASMHRLWQRVHDRPVSTAKPDGADGVMSVSYIARLAHDHANLSRPASKDSPIAPETYRCAQADLKTLSDLGFAAVLLDHHADAPEQLAPTLTVLLGAPHYTDDHATVWPLSAPEAPPDPCPLPGT